MYNDLKMEEKVFVIFNTESIGDILITNTLVRNIKLYFSESKVVIVCDKNMLEAAKYQMGVSNIVTFDKQKNNSIKGLLSFVKNFPYKKPFASFVTYANNKNLIISRLIGSEHIISHHKVKLLNTDEKYKMREYTHMKDKWSGMIEALTNEHKNLPIKYIPPETDNLLIQKIKELKNPVVLSFTGNLKENDITIEDCKELIHLLNINGYTPVMTDSGDIARQFVITLKKAGCIDFVDIVNCTSFTEFANIIKTCGSCITTNNGTLLLANALNIPVVEIFYTGLAYMWGSDTNLYPAKILDSEIDGTITPQNIINAYKELMGVCV